MSAERFYKRFPVARRRACVPVTSTRPDETERSDRARAGGQTSGDGAPPEGSCAGAGRFEIKRIKGVVEQ
jgi:hypothetical protein